MTPTSRIVQHLTTSSIAYRFRDLISPYLRKFTQSSRLIEEGRRLGALPWRRSVSAMSQATLACRMPTYHRRPCDHIQIRLSFVRGVSHVVLQKANNVLCAQWNDQTKASHLYSIIVDLATYEGDLMVSLRECICFQ